MFIHLLPVAVSVSDMFTVGCVALTVLNAAAGMRLATCIDLPECMCSLSHCQCECVNPCRLISTQVYKVVIFFTVLVAVRALIRSRQTLTWGLLAVSQIFCSSISVLFFICPFFCSLSMWCKSVFAAGCHSVWEMNSGHEHNVLC